MRIRIRHGEGAASVRAAGLVYRIRDRLKLEAVEEDGRPGELVVLLDDHAIAWHTGGILEHSLGLGWPDEDVVIAKIKTAIAREAAA